MTDFLTWWAEHRTARWTAYGILAWVIFSTALSLLAELIIITGGCR